MSKKINSPSSGSTIVSVISTQDGGTGATALPGVKTNLSLITTADYNVPNGVLVLDANGKVSPNNLNNNVGYLAFDGVTSLVKAQTVTVNFKNFDSFKDYSYSAEGSRISMGYGTLVLSTGDIPGNYTFTVNGKVYNYTIDDFRPNVPTLAVIDSLGINGLASATMTGSAFSMVGITDTHLNTDWQISTVSDFSSTVYTLMANATYKTTLTYSALALNTVYYARIRYRGAKGGVSPWRVSAFKTRSIYVPNVEYAKITNSNTVAGDQFGLNTRMSSNGDRLVTGSYLADLDGATDNGYALVYFRNGLNWSIEQRLVPTDGNSNGAFGESVYINVDGSRVVIGSPRATVDGKVNAGKIHIFTRTNSTWTQEQIIQASDGLAGDLFGTSVSFDNTASRLIVGAPNATSGGFANAGKAYIYLRTGTVWTQEQIITAADQAAGNLFGCSVSLDTTATRCIIGAKGKTNNSGGIYVWTRSGTVWTVEATFINGTTANYYFGASVFMKLAGDFAVVGCPGYFSSHAGQGAAFILSRSGATWTIRYTALASDPQVGAAFGTSVSMSTGGTIIAIGAPYTSGNVGTTYVYSAMTTAWTSVGEVKIQPSDGVYGTAKYFGYSTSLTFDGTKIAIGAYGDNNSKGAVYQITS